MVTSTMDAVDEGTPNFEELSSKTSCAFLWWQAERFQPIVLRTRKGFSELPVCHLSQRLNV